jgi:hypothetical protein
MTPMTTIDSFMVANKIRIFRIKLSQPMRIPIKQLALITFLILFSVGSFIHISAQNTKVYVRPILTIGNCS